MASIKVHGPPYATSAMRVLCTLYEKELDYELIHVNLIAGDHKKPPFISKNPFGQVPAFEDGDLKIYESRAITKYIATQYSDKGTELVSSDAKKQAVSDMWIEVESHHFDPVAHEIMKYELSKPEMLGLETDTVAMTENDKKFMTVLKVYEERLSESKYLAGDNFTLADLHHLPNIQYLLGTAAKRLFDSHPLVSAWVEDITARPTWVKVVALRDEAISNSKK